MRTLKLTCSWFAAMALCCAACDTIPEEPTKSVYIAGEINGEAFYWKDGVPTKLQTGTVTSGFASSIDVVGSDVYVGGRLHDDTFQPVYWKNETLVRLPRANPQLENLQLATLSLVAVLGGDVYVTSSDCQSNGECLNALWKNGAPLEKGNTFSGRIFGMALSHAGDILVSSDGYPSRVWWNGRREILSGSEISGRTASIFVSDNIVYTAGAVTKNFKNIPCYWTNSKRIEIPMNVDATAYGIFVLSGDVYLVGNQQTPGGGNRATLWKNGQSVMLESQEAESKALCIWVDGTDVHIAGEEIDATGRAVAKYWKNGVATTLSRNGEWGSVSAIVVR